MQAIRLLMLLLILMMFQNGYAARQKYHLPYYDHCSTLPTDVLIAKAERFSKSKALIDSAMVCYSVIANRYFIQDLDKDGIMKSIFAMNRLGYIYKYNHFDYEKSYGWLLEAEEISLKNGIRKYLPYIHQNLASFYELDDKGNSRQLVLNGYKKAFEESIELKDYKVMTSIFINLLTFTPKMSFILKEYRQFAKIPNAPHIEMYRFAQAFYKGCVAYEDKHYQDALVNFNHMLNLVDAPTPVMAARYRMMAISKKMQTLFVMGKDEQALTQLQTLLDLAKSQGARDVITDSYRVFYEYNRDHHRQTEATRYYALYLENKDSLLTYDKQTDITELNFQVQLNRANEQVKNLYYKKRVQDYMLLAVSILGLLAVIIAVILWRNFRIIRSKNQQLYRRSVELIRQKNRDEERLSPLDNVQTDDKTAENTDFIDRKPRYSTSRLNDSIRKILIQRIDNVFSTSDEIYDSQFSLIRLAELVNSNQSYVSQVINEQYGKSFANVLTECRINEACRRFNDIAKYGKFTIEAIASSVGFKSRTSFGAVFKRMTGLTPSMYQKMARKANTNA